MGEPRPITVTHRVAPDRHARLPLRVAARTTVVRELSGFLGSGWLQPSVDEETGHSLCRFIDFVDAEVLHRRSAPPSASGRSPPAEPAPPDTPPRWKQAFTLWLVFFRSLLVAICGYRT